LLLVLGTLSFRLREAGIDRTTIGYLSWVGLAYGLKWLWAPLVYRLPLPWLTNRLGWRRSWLLLAQVGIVLGLLGMGHFDPQSQLDALVGCAVLTAFSSATQDIALDAFRIESAAVDRQAALAASYQTGYRLAMIWAGAGGLWLTAQAEILSIPASTTGTTLTASTTASAYQNAAWQWAYSVMAASMARFDLARFGAEVFRPSPRQADLMIVAGTVTKKMAPLVVRIYNQMPEPKYVIAMGACAISGGPFKQGYNVLKGVDRYIPVDVVIPGCPPRPEALLHALITLQEKIAKQPLTGPDRPRHLNADVAGEYPVPEYGKHDLEPPNNPEIWQPPAIKR